MLIFKDETMENLTKQIAGVKDAYQRPSHRHTISMTSNQGDSTSLLYKNSMGDIHENAETDKINDIDTYSHSTEHLTNLSKHNDSINKHQPKYAHRSSTSDGLAKIKLHRPKSNPSPSPRHTNSNSLEFTKSTSPKSPQTSAKWLM